MNRFTILDAADICHSGWDIPDDPRRVAPPDDDYAREADEREHQAELANDRQWLAEQFIEQERNT